MDFPLLLMRLLHVVLGVFWGGVVFFNALFLLPAMRDAGPEGAKVGAALMRRRMLDAIPTAAVLTILSGLWLYYRVSLGFRPEYMGSAVGMTYGTGAVAAILALIVGLTLVRPAMLKAVALSQEAASGGAVEREAKMAQAQALRMRGNRFNILVTLLVAIAVVTMAIGRYV